MGGSVSQLSKENAALITKTLRAESDALATSGLSDEVIFERLAAKYETFLHEHVSDLKMGWEPAQDVTPAPLKKTNSKVDKKAQDELIIRLQVKSNFAFKPTLLVRQTSNARPLSSSGNKKSEQGPASPAPKSRRRSFAVPLPKIDESAAKVNAEPDIPVGVDSWDSVTQQPFCSICMMAFKSGSALERHEKFSSLHEKVVKRKLEEYEHSLRVDEKLDIEQIEGVHYKLMYTGRKLFWRTQDSVDFCFYNHFECKCVEVIGIHPETNAEVNRIYLDHSMLMRIIAEFFARKEFSEQELKLIASQTEEEKDESLRLSLITFMLLRLAIQDDSKSLYSEGNSICFRLSPSDPADSCPQLDTRPETCRPVQVNHRRRSSVEEINSTIQNLADETSAIMLATERAIQNSNEVSIALDAARSLSTPAQVAV